MQLMIVKIKERVKYHPKNEIMNTFIHDWKCLAEEEGTFGDKTDTHLKEYQSFTDLHSLTEKMITCVSWHPVIYGEAES